VNVAGVYGHGADLRTIPPFGTSWAYPRRLVDESDLLWLMTPEAPHDGAEILAELVNRPA
jgi:hypothetical protein